MSYRNNPTYQALMRDGIAAQGDLLVVHLSKMGRYDLDGFEVVSSPNDEHVVAHSETGHHHILRPYSGPDAGLLASMVNPTLKRNQKDADPEMRGVIEIAEGSVGSVVHKREAFTHGELILPSGTWIIARQGRPTPDGWKKVTD